ncbi:MAG TPA: 5-formyltetrahydrofolate cyclo-ligase [Verrucomicrobiae bacterium]|nr:5-formyltetrahydrofolate cyclo-ligase [Verrucomicrobiae bacterium]
MTPGPGASKSDWRRHFREQIRQLTPAERAAASSLICGRVESRPEWQRARAVFLFVPTPDEPEILPLARDALAAGKIVAFPRHCPNNDSYEAARVTELARDLTPGRFGIPEPRAECSRFPLNELDFSLVPGIGFALDGGRLGRGRGYFDRLLAAIPGFKCGVAFDCQVAPEFSLEPHDVFLDCILTPTRWHPTASRARS